MEKAVTLFPQPDSPTRPSVPPAATREVDAIDRHDRAALGVEADAEAVELQQRRRVLMERAA